jgi:hypothetical protein
VKRSGPPERRTPLKRGKKPSGRLPGPGLASGRDLARAPIRPKRETPRRRNRDDDHAPLLWSDVRLVIYTRALGRCEGCGRQLNIANMEAHHRRTRKVGPDCPCNALALCSDCHHAGTHGQPEEARELGRIVSRIGEREPKDVAVVIHGQPRPVLLSCGGTYVES